MWGWGSKPLYKDSPTPLFTSISTYSNPSSAICHLPDHVISWIIHLSEQQRTGWSQHPRVLVSPTLRAKETERQRDGGWGGERRGWGMKGIPGDEVLKSSPLLTVTGNRHTGAGTCCYQFFCSPVREWEEAEKEGSDKERGRERRRKRVREKGKGRWEGVCVCVCRRKTASLRRRRREKGGGWKELHGAVIFLSSWMLLFFFMALSIYCTDTPSSPGAGTGTRISTQPQNRGWIGPNKEPLRWQCVFLPGGRNASGFPRQAAACSVLSLESHPSSPLCAWAWERVGPCASVNVCVNVSERRIIVDVSVCAHSLPNLPGGERLSSSLDSKVRGGWLIFFGVFL